MCSVAAAGLPLPSSSASKQATHCGSSSSRSNSLSCAAISSSRTRLACPHRIALRPWVQDHSSSSSSSSSALGHLPPDQADVMQLKPTGETLHKGHPGCHPSSASACSENEARVAAVPLDLAPADHKFWVSGSRVSRANTYSEHRVAPSAPFSALCLQAAQLVLHSAAQCQLC
jgi:hypothetical protein